MLQDGRNKAATFNGEIVLFSISHDNEQVKLFGHFAIIDKEKISFYRYYFEEFVLSIGARQGRKKTHDFVRAVYDNFYPERFSTIKKALAEMRDPRKQSTKSDESIDDADSQDLAPSDSVSRETAQFKTPSEPASKKQKDQIDLLSEHLAEQQRQTEGQQGQNQEELSELQKQKQKQRQLAELQKQSREQLASLERQLEQQRKESERQQKELMQMLKEALQKR